MNPASGYGRLDAAGSGSSVGISPFRHHSSRFGDVAATSLVWLGTAALAGIVGNAAYDRMKAAFHGWRSGGVADAEGAILVAKMALVARCHSAGLPVPNLNGMTVHPLRDSRGGWLVRLTGSELSAVVGIPARDGDGERVIVQLRPPRGTAAALPATASARAEVLTAAPVVLGYHDLAQEAVLRRVMRRGPSRARRRGGS